MNILIKMTGFVFMGREGRHRAARGGPGRRGGQEGPGETLGRRSRSGGLSARCGGIVAGSEAQIGPERYLVPSIVACGDSESRTKPAGEGFRIAEVHLPGQLGDGGVAGQQQERRALDAQALDECSRRLVHRLPEETVEVEG